MYQVWIDRGVMVLYRSNILGSVLAALLQGPAGQRTAPLPFDCTDLKAICALSPPHLVIVETDLPPALESMISSHLPGVPVYSVSPDRPVVIGKCNGLEWPLTSEQFLGLLRALGPNNRRLPFPPVWARQADPARPTRPCCP